MKSLRKLKVMIMSKLQELINELCPYGVEYMNLGDFCKIQTGKGITNKDTIETGKYPVVSGGTEYMGYYNEYNREANTVTIARAGSAGYVNFINKKFYLNDKCFSIIPKDNTNTKYLYYVLKNMENDITSMKSTGSVPTVNTVKVSSISIPVPPLPVQEEIVKILDKLTDCVTELKAELKARKMQYEYYKSLLLSAGEKVRLKEVAEYSKGRILASELNASSYVGVDNLLQNKMGKTDAIYIPLEGKCTKFLPNDILIGNIRPYLKKIWFSNIKGGTNGDVLAIHITSNRIEPRYLYYVLSSDDFFHYDNSNSKGAKMPRGNKDLVMEYSFNLPSVLEQRKIINMMDKFELLSNNLTSGIPAEIEARQKQYEYYRDKLLTFKELKHDTI